jgi:phage-related minor tail protein
MVGVVAYAEGAREVARERAERMRAWAEAEARRAEERRRADEEAVRIKALEAAAASWKRSHELLAFIAEVRTVRQDGSAATSSNDAPDEWIRWAEGYARSVDPLLRPLGDLIGPQLNRRTG